jgi:alcohol sulfotransferase
MPSNVINLKEHLKDFALAGVKFSVSGRNVNPYLGMRDYLSLYYPYADRARINSVFGFVLFPSPLYGGRPYDAGRVMTNIHLAQLRELGVNLSLNLTNHYVNDEVYEKSRALLERHHVEGNSITCTSNRLAKKIRRDFPRYLLRASIIKKLNTPERIEAALEIYDQVVLPMEKNDDDELLDALPWKDRIMLFANAACGYACPDRTCWLADSQINQGRKETADCTKTPAERQAFGKVFFNVGKFYQMGYRNFKLTPIVVPEYAEEVTRRFTARQQAAAILKQHLDKSCFYLCSFPKSGRTWLSYLLANYLNLQFRLGLAINFATLFHLVSLDNFEQGKGVGVYDYYDDKRFPLILVSHDAFDEGKFGNAKTVFLTRSVFDTLVSNYFQHARVFTSDRSWKGSIKEFIRSEQGVASYCTYLNSWSGFLDGNDSAHILAYEDMHQDIFGAARRILEFMGVTVDEEHLGKAVELSSFEAMRKMETETKIPGVNFHFALDDEESARVRKGKVGGYRDYLDEEDIEYIRAYCDENLTPQSRALLAQSKN